MNGTGTRVHDAQNHDPRIRRSRRMLQDALAKLLVTKDFDKISIGDIAEASTLNRATFYDHYPDKFALLQCMVGTRFGELMARRNVRVENCETALHVIALTVCDYLAEAPVSDGTSHQGVMQTAIVGVICEMFREGLRHRTLAEELEEEVVASTVAWAIYGAALAWKQKPRRCSADRMAEMIDELVKPILTRAVLDDGSLHDVPARRVDFEAARSTL